MNNETIKQPVPWSGTFFSAKYFLMRAAAIGALFLLAHLAGLRQYTTFVTGTTGSPGVSLRLSAFYGMIYLALYLGCVVMTPIMILAAGLLGIWERRAGKLRINGREKKTADFVSPSESL